MTPSASEPSLLAALRPLRLRRSPSPSRADLERELEEARRLGHWFTEEDRQLVREHEARLSADRRSALLQRAGRGGAVALLVASTVLPLLWPVALLAGFRAFPSTSRRLALVLAVSAGAALITAGVVVSQIGRALLAPEPLSAPAALPVSGPGANALGRDLASRLERATDYWVLEGRSADGTATWRKGLVQQRDGQPVLVLPRSTWTLLTPAERRALAQHLSEERDLRAIHVGRVVPAGGFAGNTIRVEERVWP